ncbi:hypothetical protein M407DRAFT_234419 [Tulasnella calospora MUT 4182]|uniref:Uncharacterized protein n=1 Tax=Tulasnella calospora MUT 4182 TaxID=1051891 RepID=A0A0C3QKY0_9AGAM|nr:hypothetical protein M407DRAFT_234419 [Tulasnella calospora MUT 4182]
MPSRHPACNPSAGRSVQSNVLRGSTRQFAEMAVPLAAADPFLKVPLEDHRVFVNDYKKAVRSLSDIGSEFVSTLPLSSAVGLRLLELNDHLRLSGRTTPPYQKSAESGYPFMDTPAKSYQRHAEPGSSYDASCCPIPCRRPGRRSPSLVALGASVPGNDKWLKFGDSVLYSVWLIVSKSVLDAFKVAVVKAACRPRFTGDHSTSTRSYATSGLICAGKVRGAEFYDATLVAVNGRANGTVLDLVLPNIYWPLRRPLPAKTLRRVSLCLVFCLLGNSAPPRISLAGGNFKYVLTPWASLRDRGLGEERHSTVDLQH